MLWNVCSNCKIWSKIDKMGPFLVNSWLIQKLPILGWISFLLTPVYLQGSVQKFWKFARKLNLIWAFRKKITNVRNSNIDFFESDRFLRQCLLSVDKSIYRDVWACFYTITCLQKKLRFIPLSNWLKYFLYDERNA